MMSSLRACDNCGQGLRPGVRFCPECGSSVQAPEQAETQSGPAWPGYTPTATWSAAAPVAEPGTVPAQDTVQAQDTAPSRPSAALHREAEPWSAAKPPGPAPPATRPTRSRRLLLVFMAAVVLGAGTTAGLLLLGHHSASSADQVQNSVSARSSSSAAAPSSSATSPGSALTPQQQAANGVAALLAQSGADRTAITAAVADVEGCSANLSQDEMTFENAASSRQALLGKLAAVPDRSALPASLLQNLTTAWQASAQADQDFASWTHDEISQGCSTTSYQSDANFAAAAGPDGQATTNKKAFAAAWTAIASEYNLPTYQWNQI